MIPDALSSAEPTNTLAADVAAAVDDALARRLAEHARRRSVTQADRTRRAAARDAGLRARHARKLVREAHAMTAPSDDLRRTLADLSPRQRRIMQQQAVRAADRWAAQLPAVAKVWRAFAGLAAEVDDLDRARRAADVEQHQMKPAKRARP